LVYYDACSNISLCDELHDRINVLRAEYALYFCGIQVINTIIAVYQEKNAEETLEALKKMNAHMTVVIRDGKKLSIDATELVPGDIIVLDAGDMIPADARIIKSVNLKVEESVLTGESVPVEKDADAVIPDNAPLGDNFNMLFSGCMVTNGRAEAVVVETGMNTKMGRKRKSVTRPKPLLSDCYIINS